MTTPEETRIDSARVAALYVEHADDLKAFLIGVLRDRDLASEALQSTFIKTMESGHTVREESLKGWLFRVAFHEAMAIRRRQKLHQKSVRKWISRQSEQSDSPEENVSRWETVNQVKKALKTLPEDQQRIVQMRIYEEKTFAVIAEELQLPLGTVLTRMRLALKKLADRIDK